MGRVISLEAWREGQGAVTPVIDAPADDGGCVDRLEQAVLRLEALLPQESSTSTPAGGIDLETELLAIKGALSLSRFEEAAERAERLVQRLGGGLVSRA